MTATLSASADVIQIRYNKGCPKLVYNRAKAKTFMALPKSEDWKGGDWHIAVQNENPQGSSADFDVAVGSLAQGNYRKFTVPRVEHFGLARIKSQALEAVKEDEGAFVDLWKNEVDGAMTTELMNHEIYLMGDGSGILGAVSSGSTVTNATITLTTISDAAKFCLNMRVRGVTTGLTPTLLAGTATITGINRATGTLTVASTWSGEITGLVAGTHSLVRAGDQASGGTPTVLSGIRRWIDQTASTRFGLDSTSDVVRFAGLTYDATGVPYGEALVEASARVNQQGGNQPTLAVAHPRDIANFKKSVDAKRTYTRDIYNTKVGVSFPAIVVEGDEGEIKMISSPFQTRNVVGLLDPDSWKIRSLKAAPHIQDFDDNQFMRVSGADALEVRIASWLNVGCFAPYSNVIITNWGA
jgi:hypothetical protein